MKCYAVRKGRVPGIYSTWAECKSNVDGYSGAEYKKFDSEQDASVYMGELKADEVKISVPVSQPASVSDVTIYVDGSYNVKAGKYGYGVYIDDGAHKQVLCGGGDAQTSGRNIEGEVAGATEALKWLMKHDEYTSAAIYYDYNGIGMWADGVWKTNEPYTRSYRNFVSDCRDHGKQIDFLHVSGHTGVEGNEYVDKLAKIGCGIELSPSEERFVSQLSDVPGYPAERMDFFKDVANCLGVEYDG